MLTALRRTVQAALEELPVTRRPALRRSDDPQALLATDLPLTTDAGTVARFVARLEADGWRVCRRGDWLLLDADVPVPPWEIPAVLDGEAGCCISLLLRHPGDEADRTVLREIVKAAESGRTALERLCARLHAEWAAALREHRNLPGGLLPYLCRADDITRS